MTGDVGTSEKPQKRRRRIGGATYVCMIGCPADCEHGEPCEIGSLGREDHPAEHRATGNGVSGLHYWVDGQPCRFEAWA